MIRVLVVEPGHGTDPLTFQVRHVQLGSSDARYEALSYAWGTTMVAFLNKYEIFGAVPESLYRALLSLRHRSDQRVLWADALCINQRDEEEKGRQVRLMRKIYKQATKVLLWLGGPRCKSSTSYLCACNKDLQQRSPNGTGSRLPVLGPTHPSV
jgi:hypothetical protein